MRLEELKFYAIKNHEGKYFTGGYFTGDLRFIKIYEKIGHARSHVTTYAKHHQYKPLPILVEVSISETKELDETARLNKVLGNK